MKIKFDRTAFQNETSVLTNFEKKYEVSGDTQIRDLVTKYVNQHLKQAQVSQDLNNWRILAIKNMAYRELAVIRMGQLTWVNGPDETVSDFFGPEETATILAIHQKNYPVVPETADLTLSLDRAMKDTGEALQMVSEPAGAPSVGEVNQGQAQSSTQGPDPDWQRVPLPIRVETKVRQLLAMTCGLLSLGSVYLLVSQYQTHKSIMTEAIISGIAFGMGFYYLLLKGRRIIFRTKTVTYRNRYNRYEKFNMGQFEHVEWMNHGEDIKFIFRYEEKGRNFITASSEKYLELVVWAISNGIPIYTTDSVRKR